MRCVWADTGLDSPGEAQEFALFQGLGYSLRRSLALTRILGEKFVSFRLVLVLLVFSAGIWDISSPFLCTAL